MATELDTLIPHRTPMQWIDALVDCTETTALATVCFTKSHLGVTKGAVTETALVECVAQTVAAALGERSRKSGQTSIASKGMLGAVSGFRIHLPVPMETRIFIDVRELRRFGPMLLIAGTVTADGRLVAEGELSLYA